MTAVSHVNSCSVVLLSQRLGVDSMERPTKPWSLYERLTSFLGSLGPYFFSSIFNRIYLDVRLVQDARMRQTKYVDPTRVRRDTKNIFNRMNAVPKLTLNQQGRIQSKVRSYVTVSSPGLAHNRHLSDNHQNLNLIKISQKQPEFHPYTIPPDIWIIMKMK